MGEIVTAVYRGGALYPLQPLDLRESEHVRIQVLPKDQPANVDDAALSALAAAGLITLPTGRSTVPVVSEQKRIRLARKLGSAPGKPLSTIIIEERGE
jgi:predicted DNA-binding antitoxin AbrB/MazE fold protein